MSIDTSAYLFAEFPYNNTAQRRQWSLDDLNLDLYRALERKGFEIGYHSNAVGQARLRYNDTVTRYPETLPPGRAWRSRASHVPDGPP